MTEVRQIDRIKAPGQGRAIDDEAAEVWEVIRNS